MDWSEVEAEGERILASLDEIVEFIRPMLKEEFVRDDPILEAFNSIGAARIPLRKGFGILVKQREKMEGG